jgi:hypothetical protein
MSQAYLLVQATSLLGLLYVTDFKWTFARAQPSGLRQGPARIEAPRPQPIVPGAWHVGLLLRTAG